MTIQEPTQNQSPIEPPVPATAQPGKDAAGLSFNAALIMCATSIAAAVLIALFAPGIAAKHGVKLPGSLRTDQVVYLDFERVITAGMKRTMNSGKTGAEEVRAEADQFQAAVGAAIQRYSDDGYIIINSKALIGATKAKDITGDVLVSLGFE